MKSKRKKSYSPLTTIIIATGLYLLTLGGMSYLIYIDKNYPMIQKEKIIYDCTEDDWICKNYKNKLKFEEDIKKYSNFTEPISKFIDNYFTDDTVLLRLEILKEQLSKLRTIHTVGDGTCLIHAFLTSTSKNYRRLSYSNKRIAGQEFRENFSEELNIPSDYRIYIDDVGIQNISNIFKYNFLIFHYTPSSNLCDIRFVYVGNEIINNYPWIMNYNTENNHFSAVMSTENNQYIFEKGDNNIIHNIINFVNDKRIKDIAYKSCGYKLNDIINFENNSYIIIERKFFGDPPKCYSLIIKNIDTNQEKKIFLYELLDNGEPNFEKPINNIKKM